MTGLCRRKRGFIPAIVALILSVFSLASAPALAASAIAGPFPPLKTGIEANVHTETPCTDRKTGQTHSQHNHAGQCLAACLSVHGAVLPQLPSAPDAGLRTTTAFLDGFARKLASRPHGLDPPPPRKA